MIYGLHSDNDLHQSGIVLANVFDELALGIGWTCYEYRTSVSN
jgi:hypothetical protein